MNPLSEEKNFLQSIKLEISRSFKLEPYERVAFHNILGILKSDSGKNLLLREMEKGGDISASAIKVLAGFNDESLIPLMTSLLEKKISPAEIEIILDFIRNNGGENQIQAVINFIEKTKDDHEAGKLLRKAFNTLRYIGAGSSEAASYLLSTLRNNENVKLFYSCISALSLMRKTDIYEELLKRNDDETSYHVFLSIYNLNREIFKEDTVEDAGENPLYEGLVEKQMTPDEELLLNIKVLLGKITSRYENYSIKTKSAFINAMLSCNHRESVIFTMKALESRDDRLRRMVLYSIYSNITLIRFPEKLLRSLISMDMEQDRDNELVVRIFHRYFSGKEKSRTYTLFRDKMFSYISATLEAFFETYRREFMIPDVVDKSLPENFRRVKNYMLKKMNPEQKRRLLGGFTNEGKDFARRIIPIMGEWINYIPPEDTESLSCLLDLMLDDDRVSRDNTVNRLETVNFDKRYLQSRIVRLCSIIETLQIEGAAKSLVYIYNYLKKYPDPEIYEGAIVALSRINYSYMLSEVEIMLTAGSPEEQLKAVQLLPLFTEKRLLNILVEYLKNNFSSSGEIVSGITGILMMQNIKSNINAANVFKQMIENNSDGLIRQKAIAGLGHCAFTEDIDYLHDLFLNEKNQILKETIVKSICSIMAVRADYSKQQLSRQVQEYLKDPGIRVRIFSCMILIRLGNKDAFRSVREMLIIKNRAIQREILSVLRDIHTTDFNFFLISLLREEYGISRDIIDILQKLPEEELKEIESFIVNIFRKYELPQPGTHSKESNRFTGIDKKKITVLTVDILNFSSLEAGLNYYELIEIYLLCDLLLIPEIRGTSGTISHKESNRITICYNDPFEALAAAVTICSGVRSYNNSNVLSRNINVGINLVTDEFMVSGDELFEYAGLANRSADRLPVSNRIFFDDHTESLIRNRFYSLILPEMLVSDIVYESSHYEYISPINFNAIATSMLDSKEDAIDRQKELKAQIEAQIKTVSAGNRSTTSIAIAGELENIGIKLKNQFDEIEKYMNRRSTDRELNRNIKVMLTNVYNLYRIEISKLTIK